MDDAITLNDAQAITYWIQNNPEAMIISPLIALFDAVSLG